MVSGRLSLPQSFQAQPLNSSPRASGSAQSDPVAAQGSSGFEAYLAPERQDLRSSDPQTPDRSGPSLSDSSRGDLDRQDVSDPDRVSENSADSEQYSDTEITEDASGDSTADDADQPEAGDQETKQDPKAEDDSRADDQPDADDAATDTDATKNAESQTADAPEVPVANATAVDDAKPVERRDVPRQSGEVREGVEPGAARTSRSERQTSAAAPAATEQADSPDIQSRDPRPEQASPAAPVRSTAESKPTSEAANTRVEADRAAAADVSRGATGDAATGDDTAADDGDGEAPRQNTDTRGEQAQGTREQGISTPLSGTATTADPAVTPDEQPKVQTNQRNAEAPRPNAEPVAPRAEAVTQDLPAAPKAPVSNVADRVTIGQSQLVDRGSIHAVREADGATNQAVARGMNAVLRQGGGALTMKLSPASLGEVRIEMTMQNGRVSVQFDVGNVAAYQAIKSQMTELRQSLEQRGMTVERVETHVSPALARSAQSEGNSNNRGGEQAGQQSQQERHDASGEQSRGYADAEHGRRGEGWTDRGSDGLESEFEQSLQLGLDAVA